MSNGMVKIGREFVDINKPADVVTALKKMQLRIASGGLRETVRIDGEELGFQRANLKELKALITEYEGLAAKASGKRRRHAMRVRF